MRGASGSIEDQDTVANYFATIWKPKTGKDMSYLLSAKDVRDALRNVLLPTLADLHFSSSTLRHWRTNGQLHSVTEFIHVLRDRSAPPKTPVTVNTMRWGITVHAVPRMQKTSIRDMLIHNALPNLAVPWFKKIVLRRNERELAVLTIVYDEANKSLIGKTSEIPIPK
jgi:hypothetical protein